MSNDQVELVLAAIQSLRNELSQRMDRQDAERIRQWAAITEITKMSCPGERHIDMEKRMRIIEADRAKVLGIVATVSVIASLVGWFLERILK